MNISFPDKTAAQKRVDEIHAALKLESKLYKASCDLYDAFGGAKGGTRAWAEPYQDKDKDGIPLDTLWHVTVAERVRKVLTKAETDTVVEWGTTQTVDLSPKRL